MSTKPASVYESLNRQRKVTALVAVITDLHARSRSRLSIADAAERLTNVERLTFCRVAKIKPALDETWAEVIKALREHEA